jgi:16S rRNA (adenine1518-N6/adenine1519-N6)-dimethyltransferase
VSSPIINSLRPKKSLGQNFLRDENISRKIVSAISPQPSEVVLEIGPGEGALTKYLAPLVRKLIVVDIDRRVIARLQDAYPNGEVETRHEDFLDSDLDEIARQCNQPIRIVGNIPYNITSPILFHVLDNRSNVIDMTVMLQREVAGRIIAVSGTKTYGILSVFCQFYADVKKLFDVAPGAFYPRPNVSSSVIRFTMLAKPRYAVDDEQFFRAMVRTIFGKRRKTLRNSLRYFVDEKGMKLPPELGSAKGQRRPEVLSISELVELSNTLIREARHGA